MKKLFKWLFSWFKKTQTPIPFSYKGKKFVLVWKGDGWMITKGDNVPINLKSILFSSSEAAQNWIKDNIDKIT